MKYSSLSSEKSHGEIRVYFVKKHSIINKITTTNNLFWRDVVYKDNESFSQQPNFQIESVHKQCANVIRHHIFFSLALYIVQPQ
jgi:hypothetical protein